MRLADDTVTVRELLASTGGIDSPAGPELLADQVPDLAAVTGPVISCGGPRDVVRPSNGGTAALGQLLAEVTATSFAAAAARLVLRPLGMNESSFPGTAAEFGPRAVSCYGMDLKGRFCPRPGEGVHAAGRGRAVGDRSGPCPARCGMGIAAAGGAGALRAGCRPRKRWRGTAGPAWAGSSPRAGTWRSAAAPCRLDRVPSDRVRDGRVLVAVTTRLVPVGLIHAHVLRAWADAAR